MLSKKLTIFFLLGAIFILSGVVLFRYVYPNFFQVALSMKKNSEIGLSEAVVINFSFPVRKENYTKGIHIEPSIGATVEWQDNYKKLIIAPKDKWKMETKYKISLPAGRSQIFSKIESQAFNFFTPSYPRVKSFSPVNGTRDVILGVEDPIIANFDKSLDDFNVKFSINPEMEIVYRNTEVKDQLKIMPKTELQAGQKYEIKILAKSKEEVESEYKEIYQTSFETLPPPPEKWEKDFTLRLDQARKYTRAKVLTGKYIDINLTSQIMSIFENGQLIDSFMVSSGKKGMETPAGNFSIHNKSPRVWSKKYGLWMPYWMAVASDGSFGIHELPEWPGGYKEGANHLGTPISHGCIRLGVGPAKQAYDFTEVGMPVIIY